MKTSFAPTTDSAAQVVPWPESAPSWLSALTDGEVDAASWDDRLWAQVCGDDTLARDLALDWHGHHLVGEALRGELSAASVASLSGTGALSFAQQVVAKARIEAGADLAVPAAAAAVGGSVVQPSVHMVERLSRPAANDGVFRWKLVAGLASVTAVASVTWALVGLERGADPSRAEMAQAEKASSAATVVVATEQGLVERDARLQALMQAHRQNGGATAWQVPAGFLRAATHDAGQR